MEEVDTYIRVSTVRQRQSGLGLDAQRDAVAAYCKRQGCEVSREFIEIESGKKNDRAVLSQALKYEKKTHSRLIIGKLDRLARNVDFINGLMESNCDFVACDLPERIGFYSMSWQPWQKPRQWQSASARQQH